MKRYAAINGELIEVGRTYEDESGAQYIWVECGFSDYPDDCGNFFPSGWEKLYI